MTLRRDRTTWMIVATLAAVLVVLSLQPIQLTDPEAEEDEATSALRTLAEEELAHYAKTGEFIITPLKAAEAFGYTHIYLDGSTDSEDPHEISMASRPSKKRLTLATRSDDGTCHIITADATAQTLTQGTYQADSQKSPCSAAWAEIWLVPELVAQK